MRLLEADLDPEPAGGAGPAVVGHQLPPALRRRPLPRRPAPGQLPPAMPRRRRRPPRTSAWWERLSRQMREQLVLLCVAVALKDADSVARLSTGWGAPEGRASLAAFRSDIDGLLRTATCPGPWARWTPEPPDRAARPGGEVPGPRAARSTPSQPLGGGGGGHPPPAVPGPGHPRRGPPLRQGALCRCITIREPDPGRRDARPARIQGLADRSPASSSRRSSSTSRPGAFSVHVPFARLAKMNTHLRARVVIAFLGFCACGFIVGAFISSPRSRGRARYPVLGLLGTATAAALFTESGLHLVPVRGNRFGKISVARSCPG